LSHYQSDTIGWEIIEAIAESLRIELKYHLKKAKMVSVMIDESMDISAEENISACIKYLNYNFSPKECFVQLKRLEKLSGKYIFEKLLEILDCFDIVKKVYGIATDGAPNMVSNKKGVKFFFLSTINPFAIFNHCICHRLALGLSNLIKGRKKNDIVASFYNFIYKLTKFFSTSHKKTGILFLNSIDENHLKLITPLDVRWLSIYPAIHRILEIYPSIVNSLIEISKQDNDFEANLYANQLIQLENIVLLLFFDQILSKIFIISKTFQDESISLNIMIDSIEILKSSLKGILENMRFSIELEDLLSDVFSKLYSDEIEEIKNQRKIYFKGIEVSIGMDNNENRLRKFLCDIVKQIKNNIEKRFPKENLIKDYENILFNKFQSENKKELIKKGNQAIINIMKNINNFFANDPDFIKLEESKVLEQFMDFKYQLANEYKYEKEENIYRKLFSNPLFSNLHLIYQSLLLLPLSNATCERSFSRMNIIKMDLRNLLKEKHLDCLMMISMNGPEINNFSPNQGIEIFKKMKQRKYLI
jgi:hypothetical protein